MNEQIIKELLEQLQQNLKKIESAREQVEKTVNAYEALKKDVKHYTEELSFIVQNTRTMISQLEDICKAVKVKLSEEDIKYLEELYVPHPLSGVMAQNKPENVKQKKVWGTGSQKIENQ